MSMKELFVFISLLLLVAACTPSPKVCIGKACYNVEIVSTPAAREQGLMYRQSLANDSGMLFVFDKSGDYPFWMKNTLIQLDMIWIDADYNIVAIQRFAEPCKTEKCAVYEPGKNATYVLEVNGGQTVIKGINPGDKVEIYR